MHRRGTATETGRREKKAARTKRRPWGNKTGKVVSPFRSLANRRRDHKRIGVQSLSARSLWTRNPQGLSRNKIGTRELIRERRRPKVYAGIHGKPGPADHHPRNRPILADPREKARTPRRRQFPGDGAREIVPYVEIRRGVVVFRRDYRIRQAREKIVRSIVERVRKTVTQQSLHALSHRPAILRLQRAVVRQGVVSGDVQQPGEIRIRLVQRLLAQHITAGLP